MCTYTARQCFVCVNVVHEFVCTYMKMYMGTHVHVYLYVYVRMQECILYSTVYRKYFCNQTIIKYTCTEGKIKHIFIKTHFTILLA